jgi:hypothetical protein
VPTPNVKDGDALNMLTSVSAGDVWASGFADNAGEQNFRVPYVLHWTGTAWAMTKVPNPGTKVADLGGEGSALNGITVRHRRPGHRGPGGHAHPGHRHQPGISDPNGLS